jgi:spermidine synthase
MSTIIHQSKKRGLVAPLCVFVVSFSGVMLQVTLTRIFSTTLFYHYAFLAVSIALFGWGLGGIALKFLMLRLHAVPAKIVLTFMVFYSLSIPIYLLIVQQIQFAPNNIGVFYVLSLVPFCLAGICMAFFYSEHAESADKLYLTDLSGAGIACLAMEPTLALLGAETTLLLLAVLSSLACLFFVMTVTGRKVIAMSIIVLVTTSALFSVNTLYTPIRISNAPDKAMFKLLEHRPELNVSFTRWNSFSRVDLVEGFENPLQGVVFIDAGASTDILKWDGKVGSLEYLRGTVAFLPYYLVANPVTLNIGSGGGKDALIALAANSSRIVAVELNPIVIEAVEKCRGKTVSAYDDPKVELHIDEGRSFVKHSNDSYDVITLTLVDSWAAISSGGLALAENYLYTKEAFVDYLVHLGEDGLLMMVRWNFEVPRLISTTAEAFSALGMDISTLRKHIAVVMFEAEPGNVGCLFVVKKSAFTQLEAETFLNRTVALGAFCTPFYVPFVKEENEPYHSLFNGSRSLEEYCNWFSYRVDAVTDDSPYFFNTEKMVPSLLSYLATVGICLTLSSILVSWVFVARAHTKKNPGLAANSKFKRSKLFQLIVFFLALGLGYMLIEIAMMQKLILFLGYPTRALTVTLFSLLLSSGVGSFVSGRLLSGKTNYSRKISVACLSIIVLTFLYVFALPQILEYFLPFESTFRIGLTVLLIFPLGFFMGIPFPSGIRFLGEFSRENIPWIWSINGSASVLGSTLAAITGIAIGFNIAILLGAITYFVALVCATLSMRDCFPTSKGTS